MKKTGKKPQRSKSKRVMWYQAGERWKSERVAI